MVNKMPGGSKQNSIERTERISRSHSDSRALAGLAGELQVSLAATAVHQLALRVWPPSFNTKYFAKTHGLIPLSVVTRL